MTWSAAAVFSRQEQRGDRQVYRTAGPVVLWWGWLVFAVAALIALAVQGHDHAAAVTAAVLVAITGFAYACALRPRIVADSGGITVVNPLREHILPWAAVSQVELAQTVRVHCCPRPGTTRERVVHSWAVQSSARARTRSELRARRAARQEARMPGYAQRPGTAQEVLAGSTAEFIARQLDERAQREHQRAGSPGPGGPAEPGGPAGPGSGMTGSAGTGPGLGDPAGGGPSAGRLPRVRWSWQAMAAMAVPLLILTAVSLT